MTQLPILYSFRRCPYAIRARMALQAGQRQVELREISLKAKPDEFLAASEKATVPVLVLTDGTVLEESLDIMQWALSTSETGSVQVPVDWVDHELIQRNDGEFKDHLDHYKYADRFPEATESDYRDRAKPYLEELESILSGQPYLTGTSIAVLDLAIFPFIRQFAAVDREWFESCEFRRLRSWHNQLLQSEMFLSVMPKYKPWSVGDTPQVFPLS